MVERDGTEQCAGFPPARLRIARMMPAAGHLPCVSTQPDFPQGHWASRAPNVAHSAGHTPKVPGGTSISARTQKYRCPPVYTRAIRLRYNVNSYILLTGYDQTRQVCFLSSAPTPSNVPTDIQGGVMCLFPTGILGENLHTPTEVS